MELQTFQAVTAEYQWWEAREDQMIQQLQRLETAQLVATLQLPGSGDNTSHSPGESLISESVVGTTLIIQLVRMAPGAGDGREHRRDSPVRTESTGAAHVDVSSGAMPPAMTVGGAGVMEHRPTSTDTAASPTPQAHW